jgi:hypothetical protein
MFEIAWTKQIDGATLTIKSVADKSEDIEALAADLLEMVHAVEKAGVKALAEGREESLAESKKNLVMVYVIDDLDTVLIVPAETVTPFGTRDFEPMELEAAVKKIEPIITTEKYVQVVELENAAGKVRELEELLNPKLEDVALITPEPFTERPVERKADE